MNAQIINQISSSCKKKPNLFSKKRLVVCGLILSLYTVHVFTPASSASLTHQPASTHHSPHHFELDPERHFLRPRRTHAGQPRCVFVDIGANKGDTMDSFLRAGNTAEESPDNFVSGEDVCGYNNRVRSPWSMILEKHFVKKGCCVPGIKTSPADRLARFWCQDYSVTLHFEFMGCPTIRDRRNIDYYALEANPEHNERLKRQYDAHPEAIRGLYVSTAVWNSADNKERSP